MNSYFLLTRRRLIISCLAAVVFLFGTAQASDVGNQNTGASNCGRCILPAGCNTHSGGHVDSGETYCR